MKTFVTKYTKPNDPTEWSGPSIIAPDVKSAKKHLQKLREDYPTIELAGELVEILEEGKEGRQILHD
jgi:hypothetical protein